MKHSEIIKETILDSIEQSPIFDLLTEVERDSATFAFAVGAILGALDDLQEQIDQLKEHKE